MNPFTWSKLGFHSFWRRVPLSLPVSQENAKIEGKCFVLVSMNLLVLRSKNKVDSCECLNLQTRFVKIPWWILMKNFGFRMLTEWKRNLKVRGVKKMSCSFSFLSKWKGCFLTACFGKRDFKIAVCPAREILCLITGSSRSVFKAGCQQEIPTGDIPTVSSLPTHYKFYIYLWGQVACRVLDLRPPFIWNTG